MANLTTNDWLNLGKFILAGLIFIGYFLILILSMVLTLPENSGTIVLQGLAVLGPVIGGIAYSLWPKGNDQDRQIINDLANKVPPITGEAKVSQDESIAAIAAAIPAQAETETLPDWVSTDPSATY